MESNQRAILAVELIELIKKGNAHVPLEGAIGNLPSNLRTKVPENLPYSIWQLVEHIRITQWDIVEFCLSADHKSPEWPDEYWVKNPSEISDQTWESSLQEIEADRNRFFNLLRDEKSDLLAPFPHGSGQNLLREAMLIADHTAYHTGEIIVIRRILNNWQKS